MGKQMLNPTVKQIQKIDYPTFCEQITVPHTSPTDKTTKHSHAVEWHPHCYISSVVWGNCFRYNIMLTNLHYCIVLLCLGVRYISFYTYIWCKTTRLREHFFRKIAEITDLSFFNVMSGTWCICDIWMSKDEWML